MTNLHFYGVFDEQYEINAKEELKYLVEQKEWVNLY